MDVDDYLGSIGNKLLQQLEETHSSGVKEARSRYQTFMVYARRSLGMVIYLAVLFASFCIILYVTLYSDYIAQNVKSIPGLRNMQSFIAPLILAMISSAMPEISKALTSLESWDSAQTIHTLNLLRVYISSLLNTLLLVFSYLVLADPFLLANDSSLRNSFGLSESLDFSCRMDQVSDGLFTLVVFTWVIQNTMLFAMPYAMRLFYYLFRRPSKKQEFHVSDNMVKRLDWMGLVFAAVPFCPMGFVFMPILLGIGFKWERYVIRKHYAKPTRMFSGQKAGLIYTFFYLCTFLTIGMTMAGYFFTSKTFAKECAIQDQYVDLCDPASTLASDNTCTMDPSSEYYGFYRSEQYPKVICERACGAFVNEVSHLSPFHFRVNSLFIMSYIWIACFDYPYIPWVGLLLLLLWVARVRNSLMVFRLSWFNKERSMDARLQANEAERKKQEKMIRKLKTIEEGEDGGGKEE